MLLRLSLFAIDVEQCYRLCISLPRRFRPMHVDHGALPSGIGLRIIELALIKMFRDFDSIRMNFLPPRSRNLTDPQ